MQVVSMDGKPVAFPAQPDPFDPDGICDRCGQKGTVVRSGRQDVQSATMGRYCPTCWPAQRAEQVRQSVEEGAQYSTLQRDPAPSWDRVVALVVAVERALPPAAVDDPKRKSRRRSALVSVAHEIAAAAAKLDGPMPHVVQDFIARAPRRP